MVSHSTAYNLLKDFKQANTVGLSGKSYNVQKNTAYETVHTYSTYILQN